MVNPTTNYLTFQIGWIDHLRARSSPPMWWVPQPTPLEVNDAQTHRYTFCWKTTFCLEFYKCSTNVLPRTGLVQVVTQVQQTSRGYRTSSKGDPRNQENTLKQEFVNCDTDPRTYPDIESEENVLMTSYSDKMYTFHGRWGGDRNFHWQQKFETSKVCSWSVQNSIFSV